LSGGRREETWVLKQLDGFEDEDVGRVKNSCWGGIWKGAEDPTGVEESKSHLFTAAMISESLFY
jgi:hypothetical protein